MHLLFGVRQLQWFSVGFLSGSMKCRYSENPYCSAMNATNAISGLAGTALTAASHSNRAQCSESTSALYTCCEQNAACIILRVDFASFLALIPTSAPFAAGVTSQLSSFRS